MLRSRAFTLVELLICMGIIVLLAALLFPVSDNLIREANRAKCTGNLRALGGVWNNYAADHDGYYPSNGYTAADTFGNWGTFRGEILNEIFEGKYADSPNIFFCPDSPALRYPKFGREHAAEGGLYSFTYAMYSGQYAAELYNESMGNNLPPARKMSQATSKTPLLFDESSRYAAEGWSLVNHYNKQAKKPYGGNVVYGDGHVSWRAFPEMIMVMNAGGGHRRYY